MGALKAAINPKAAEFGIYICGGRGKHSLKTPEELLLVGDKNGLDGNDLVRTSRLVAKVDSTAIQDGFQVYLHSFIVSDEGDWSVVQQGMNSSTGYARRYHWSSKDLQSFVNEPHTFIHGKNQGYILNLTHKYASDTRNRIVSIGKEDPSRMIQEIQKMKLPSHHDVQEKDVDLRRLGAVLALSNELPTNEFEDLLLVQGLGPRTLQSLTLVSEVIYGTQSRFADPARFSFAHGGKDGHPFPVPTKVYDESIRTLKTAVAKAKIGSSDKLKALKSLSLAAEKMEGNFTPNGNLDSLIERERTESWKYGGRTVSGFAKKPKKAKVGLVQGSLF